MKTVGILILLIFFTVGLNSCATSKKKKARIISQQLKEVDEYDSDNLYDYDSDMGTAVMGYYSTDSTVKKKVKRKKRRRKRK